MAEKNSKKVLIVEDEQALATTLQLKFQKSGFIAKSVANGDEALKELNKSNYDVIILDLIMPKKDGFATLVELRQRANTVPVIVTSNLGQEEDIKRVKALGAVDYLIKSDTPILEIVERAKNLLVT